MNGLDQFLEAALAIFVAICGLMVLLTRLEDTLDEATSPGSRSRIPSQPEDVDPTSLAQAVLHESAQPGDEGVLEVSHLTAPTGEVEQIGHQHEGGVVLG